MSVIYIKTYAGENILATLIDETANTIAITNPLKIDTCMTANRVMTTIYPWVPIRELMAGNYTLDKSKMVGIMEIPEHVLTNYNRIITEIHSDDDDMASDAMANESDIENEQLMKNRILH